MRISQSFSNLPKRLLAAVSILVFTMLSMVTLSPVAFADDVDQATLEDGTIERTNPFPELITDEEAQQNFEELKNSFYDGKNLSPAFHRIAIERNGKLIPVKGSRALFQPGDILRLGIIMNATHDAGSTDIGTTSGFRGYQLNQIVDSNGITRLDPDLAHGQFVFLQPEVYLNGEHWQRNENGGMWLPANNSTTTDVKNPVIWPAITYFQYIEYRLTIPTGIVYLDSRTKGHVGTIGGTLYFQFSAERLGSAQFTPVDDFDYRAAAGLKISPGPQSDADVALPERSAGKPALDSTSFQPIDHLQPLADAKVARAELLRNFPMLRDANHPVGENDKLQYAKQSSNPDDINAPRTWLNNIEDRPSLEDLTGREIPGYVYVSNDIDKAAPTTNFTGYPQAPQDGDNSRISYAIDSTGTFPSAANLPQDRPATENDLKGADYLTNKYYYVTYRQIPAPVKVSKVDDKNKALAGACFTLNKTVDGKPVELLTDLCSTDDGEVLPAAKLDAEQIKDFIKHNNPLDATHSVYKTEQGGYLLTPGDYTLVETKVPEGYLKAKDTKFTVNLQTEADITTTDVSVTNSPKPVEPPAPTEPPATPEPPKVIPPATPETPDTQLANTGISLLALTATAGLLFVGLGTLGVTASRRRR